MNDAELTGPAILRRIGCMMRQATVGCRPLLAVPVLGALALGGCISVKAPDKPIVIELNIKIEQEVVYRLAGDAARTIENNKEIF